MKYQIRWCLQSDIPELVLIERQSYPHPWSHEDFSIALKKMDHVGFVIELDKDVIGYLIYKTTKTSLEIVGLAVHPAHRKNGAGRHMIEYLMKKNKPKRNIKYLASDEMLSCHNFFKKMGFQAIKVLRNYFGPNHDGYEFVLFVQETTVKKRLPKKGVSQ